MSGTRRTKCGFFLRQGAFDQAALAVKQNPMKKLSRSFSTWTLLLPLAALLAGHARAQPAGFIAITNAAGYSENFDSMGSSASSTITPPGWFVGAGTGAISGTTVRVGDGNSLGGGSYNWGTSGSSDRALGSLVNGIAPLDTEARFKNLSGSMIVSFTISYSGEQWRPGSGG